MSAMQAEQSSSGNNIIIHNNEIIFCLILFHLVSEPMAADLELPRSQFEEIPRNEMNEALRKQFEMNCGAVLDKSNKIHGENRQLIINFLGGHHTKPERKSFLYLFFYLLFLT
jgi:hypothetical protein